ncbi:DedA family protein [Laspinema olomoucense]|uniref:DedA family protein n=1 Tax=Laspinema olomoucense D3b TaxID=2953688 RepID=A0ABT2NFM0_9CYAN|nr:MULTISPECIES: DedA family protein [unclassified Laspinema]MCT7981504.1 DedA family protein [Laspinema sp. D3b]MCT7988509.1 DedA family protein [Laspinema sp. D3a]MCT7993958.1 DedA family protein [Laspinema sp. D3c]
MLDWITNTITALNYWGIALLMFLENIIPPIPSELIMPLAGFTVTQGKLTFWGVIVAGTTGSMLGALPWYYVSLKVGEHQLKKWVDRYGGWVTLTNEDIKKSQDWFKKYGGGVVLFGRLIPGIRTLISIPAGLQKMPFLEFFGYSLIGSLCWNLLLTYAGFVLGKNYKLVDKFLGPVTIVVLGGLVLLFIFWLVQRKKQRKRQ